LLSGSGIYYVVVYAIGASAPIPIVLVVVALVNYGAPTVVYGKLGVVK
jgi:hypothetical protein